MRDTGRKKLVLIGTGVVHTFKYLDLISSFFDEILLITDKVKPELKVQQVAFDFSLRNPIAIPGKIKTLRALLDAFDPDIIHVHQANSVAFYTIKACRKKYPVVVTAWGSDVLSTPLKGMLYRKMLQYVLKNADCFTSDSLFMADEMRKIAGKKSLEILIANFGIDIIPTQLEKEALVYSNRQLTSLYRIPTIIEIFREFIFSDNKYRHWQLAIAATGEEESNLRDLVKEYGIDSNVRFYGWVDKVANSELYSKARIYISIPRSDATSISLLEAMASGCLPVVSDLPANREWVRDGMNGIIYKSDLRNPLLRALEINAETAARMNKEIIEKEGMKEANKVKFISMYEHMLHGK